MSRTTPSSNRSRGRFLAVGIALLVVLLGVTALLLTGPLVSPPAAPGATPVDVAPEPAATARAAASSVAAERPAEPLRAAVGKIRQKRSAPLPATDPVVFGRCVDGDGKPLAGCRISLRALQPDSAPPPAPGFTDRDGRFSLLLPAHTAYELRFRSPGRATLAGPSGSLEPGRRVDLGDLALRRGVTVLGSVLDTEGAAVEGLEVSLRHDPRGVFRNLMAPLRLQEARSDSAGGLRFDEPVLPGTWHVMPPSHAIDAPTELEITGREPTVSLDLRVDTEKIRPRIVGRVVDQFGAAVAGAMVLARKADGEGRGTTVTREDGGFELRRDGSDDKPVRLAVRAAGCEDAGDPRELAWGTMDVRLQVVRGATLRVAVRNRSGDPVEEFALHVFSPRTNEFRDVLPRSSGRHPGGVALARGISSGAQLVWVRPGGDRLVQDGLLRIMTTGGLQSCQVIVDPRLAMSARVLGSDGAPIPAARLELLLSLGGEPITAATPSGPLDEIVYSMSEKPALQIAVARTDARGLARIGGHPRTRYTLRVTALGYVPLVMPVVLSAVAEPWRLQLKRGARVTGSLQPRAVVAAFQGTAMNRSSSSSFRAKKVNGHTLGAVRLMLTRTVQGTREVLHPSVALKPDGSFAFESVPPGSWQLDLRWVWWSPGREEGEAKARSADVEHVEHTKLAWLANLVDGEQRRVDVPLHTLGLGALTGHALWGKRPLGSFTIEPVGGAVGTATPRLGWTYGKGRFRLVLPAGLWRCVVRRPGKSELLVAPLQANVVAGASVEVEWKFEPPPPTEEERKLEAEVKHNLRKKLRARRR